MKAISIASIVLGVAALLLCGFDLFANGVLELLPLLVAGIAVLVGLVGLRVQHALTRLAAAESEIQSQQQRSLTLSEQLRNEGLLSATGERTTAAEIGEILE